MSFLVDIKNLSQHFVLKKGLLQRPYATVKAVDNISLQIQPGHTLGLVGESGCGKSTLGRTLLRLYEPTSGEVIFKKQNLAQLSQKELRQQRRSMQMIFQDPYASLDPRMTVGQILQQPFIIHKTLSGPALQQKVEDLLNKVGLKASDVHRYPHEFSGGQRQRIAIARAVALDPEFIVCDEPVSALDVSIQAQILNLLKDLQQQLGLTYLFISHDLSVIRYFCDTVAVMYLGRIVEQAPTQELFNSPQHPYTQALLQAIPRMNPQEGARTLKKSLSGEVPSPLHPPSGCHFHPRCPHKMDLCQKSVPDLYAVHSNHLSRCFLAHKGEKPL